MNGISSSALPGVTRARTVSVLPSGMADDGSDPNPEPPVATEPRAECETCGWTGPPTSKAAMGHAVDRHPGQLPTFRVVPGPRCED